MGCCLAAGSRPYPPTLLNGWASPICSPLAGSTLPFGWVYFGVKENLSPPDRVLGLLAIPVVTLFVLVPAAGLRH